MSILIKCPLFMVFIIFSVGVGAKDLDADRKIIQQQDPRNLPVDFTIETKGKALWFCVQDIHNQAKPVDVFRVFMQTAEHFQSELFDQVVLCFRNKGRFVLSGQHFRQIGEEFGVQNPVYTIRTFPEKLKTLTGEVAFTSHRGGALYQMRMQMEDFNRMHNEWYLGDLLAEWEAVKESKRPKVFSKDEEVF